MGKKDFWEKMDCAMEEAAKKAIAETHAAGRPSYHKDDKGEYYLHPDGKKEYVKKDTEKLETKDFREMTKEEKEALFSKGVKQEIAKHHAAGRATTHADEKGIYRLYPDGSKKYIEEANNDHE